MRSSENPPIPKRLISPSRGGRARLWLAAQGRKSRVSASNRSGPALDPGALGLLREELGEDLGDYLQRFGAGLPLRLRVLELAIAHGDLPLIEGLAHGLRGGSGWYGASLLSRRCAGLEQQASLGKLEHVHWLFRPLANEVARVRAEIDRLFPPAPDPTMRD